MVPLRKQAHIFSFYRVPSAIRISFLYPTLSLRKNGKCTKLIFHKHGESNLLNLLSNSLTLSNSGKTSSGLRKKENLLRIFSKLQAPSEPVVSVSVITFLTEDISWF